MLSIAHVPCLKVSSVTYMVYCSRECRVAHDCTMPTVLQSTSLRLLYNLIETIFARRADVRTSELYRSLLSSVLECFVRKLGTLRAQVARIVKLVWVRGLLVSNKLGAISSLHELLFSLKDVKL